MGTDRRGGKSGKPRGQHLKGRKTPLFRKNTMAYGMGRAWEWKRRLETPDRHREATQSFLGRKAKIPRTGPGAD